MKPSKTHERQLAKLEASLKWLSSAGEDFESLFRMAWERNWQNPWNEKGRKWDYKILYFR